MQKSYCAELTGDGVPATVKGMDKPHENWISVPEAAKILGRTPATLRRHIKSGLMDREARVDRSCAQPKLWKPDLTPAGAPSTSLTPPPSSGSPNTED